MLSDMNVGIHFVIERSDLQKMLKYQLVDNLIPDHGFVITIQISQLVQPLHI